MQRSRLEALALGASALLGATLASPAVAARETGTTVPTFQEFGASTFKDTDQQYITWRPLTPYDSATIMHSPSATARRATSR